MHFFTVFTSSLLLLATSTEAFQARPIKENNKLWGAGGRPNTLSHNKRQASASAAPPSSVASSAVFASATSRAADGSCRNTPLTRQCWGNGYSIATDFDTKWPDTGVTRRYNFQITNTTCNPDGNATRYCLLVNEQLPGPTIFADWGDNIEVTVTNNLAHNGTSIHWHALRQLNTVSEDGVNGITECPIAPGDTRVYRWRATQYGSSWYHSHFSAQYGDGIVGAIHINGPAAANYDIDLGTYTISDWYYRGAGLIENLADGNLQRGGPPPFADTILINGTNKNRRGGGRYSNVKLTPGRKHRLRLINTAVDNSIRVSLDGHNFTVIAADFVPIRTYQTTWVLLGTGQRYDVIIDAKATPGNYWFRAEAARDCLSTNQYVGRAIFTYGETPVADPTSQPLSPAPAVCRDESPLVPWWSTIVPSTDFHEQVRRLDVDLHQEQVAGNGQNVIFWGINLTAIDINWEKPTLQYVIDKNTSYPHVYNLVELPVENIWTYWIIQETEGTLVPIPHPMHLHGHDFFVLGTGTGTFNIDTDPARLNFQNPARRDVTFLPGRGWVVIAFPTDNPGAWLMHCHIAWHISQGLGVQFLEAKERIRLPGQAWHDTCSRWKTYYNENPVYHKEDSGL